VPDQRVRCRLSSQTWLATVTDGPTALPVSPVHGCAPSQGNSQGISRHEGAESLRDDTVRLNRITGTQLNGDGELGAITREAVAFQEREGIAQTRVVDADTWERLFAFS
jgi:peptidoglycan hydrolase-like protein with peptidoglycan-binding domain